jgi:hypothetical protein
MRIITPRAHALLDYTVGAFALLAPGLLGFADIASLPAVVLRTFGVIAIIYSILTRYELGVIRRIPFGVHLKLDFIWGLLLASSPWVLSFYTEGPRVWGVHVALGVLGMLVPVISVPLRRPLTEEAAQSS